MKTLFRIITMLLVLALLTCTTLVILLEYKNAELASEVSLLKQVNGYLEKKLTVPEEPQLFVPFDTKSKILKLKNFRGQIVWFTDSRKPGHTQYKEMGQIDINSPRETIEIEIPTGALAFLTKPTNKIDPEFTYQTYFRVTK